ncbi:MAG: hypothetical protein ACREJ5_22915 [Geminicoccaceae bacterium]
MLDLHTEGLEHLPLEPVVGDQVVQPEHALALQDLRRAVGALEHPLAIAPGDRDVALGHGARHDLVVAIGLGRGLRHRALDEAHLDAGRLEAAQARERASDRGAKRIDRPKGEAAPDERRRVLGQFLEDPHGRARK